MSDSTIRSLLSAFAGPSRRNLAAAGLVVVLAVLAVLVPHWAVRYGAALAIFCIWMAWFVETLAGWLGQEAHPAADDGEAAAAGEE